MRDKQLTNVKLGGGLEILAAGARLLFGGGDVRRIPWSFIAKTRLGRIFIAGKRRAVTPGLAFHGCRAVPRHYRLAVPLRDASH